jgi:hypothetical protein
MSPELALVDPIAAERGRRHLPRVVLTEDLLQDRRVDQTPRETGELQGADSVSAGEATSRRPLVRLTVLTGAAAAVGIAAWAGVTHRWEQSSRTAQRPTSAATARPTTQGSTPSTARSIPDFAWAPVQGAVRYRIRFSRGVDVVFQTVTKAPRLHVRATLLSPGEYRWRVWPVMRSGREARSSIIDSSVTIP